MQNEIMTVRISREGELYVAECSPYDVITQGKDIVTTIERLSKQLAVEILIAGALYKIPKR